MNDTTNLEYQVSASADSDREYFTDFSEAKEHARELSNANSDLEVYIDVLDLNEDEMTGVYYTVNKGRVKKHS